MLINRLFRRPVKRVDMTHGTLIRYSDGTYRFEDGRHKNMPVLMMFLRNDLFECNDALRDIKRP